MTTDLAPLAFFGTGRMGRPMAERLLAVGYRLSIWNRTATRSEPLAALGATVAASPGAALAETIKQR